jgi:hypothetical protein
MGIVSSREWMFIHTLHSSDITAHAPAYAAAYLPVT